jgi:hypothetical protein
VPERVLVAAWLRRQTGQNQGLLWSSSSLEEKAYNEGSGYQCFGSGLDPDSIRTVDPDSIRTVDPDPDPGGQNDPPQK